MISRVLPVVLLIVGGLAGWLVLNSSPTPPAASAPDGGLAGDIPAKVEEYLTAYVDQDRFSGAVLIAQGDDVLIRKGYNQADREHGVPNTPETKFRIGSVTKSFTAVAVLQLHQQGALDIGDPLSSYMPDFPNGDRIRIKHLLRHTSGIPNYTSFEDYARMKRLEHSPAEIIERFRDRDLEFEPGAQFSYSNSNYLLLGHLIEQISDQSYASYVQQQILDPLGMTNTGYDRRAPILANRAEGYTMRQGELVHAGFVDMSVPHAAGALYSTVDDLRKWSRALATDRLLNDALRERMFTPGQGDYGYGWFVEEFEGRRRIHHSGGIEGFRAHLARFPETDVVIVVLSNFAHTPMGPIGRDLAAITFGQEYELPQKRTRIELAPEVLERYVGTYRLDEDRTVTITREGDHLGIRITGQPKFGLYPMSETEFFLERVEAEVTFVTNDAGEVTRLIIHQGGQEIPAERISDDPNVDASPDG